jgi:hypothetical protein
MKIVPGLVLNDCDYDIVMPPLSSNHVTCIYLLIALLDTHEL